MLILILIEFFIQTIEKNLYKGENRKKEHQYIIKNRMYQYVEQRKSALIYNYGCMTYTKMILIRNINKFA